jgi:hypothetical protein
MAATTKVSPNITMQIAEMISPSRMFLIAKRLFMTGAKNSH